LEKKAISGIMLTLLLIGMFTFAFNIQPVKAEPTTWTVDDDGPADFHTMQEAINAATPGDTIYVYKGIYYENVVVDKSLSLIGENKEYTVIDGMVSGIVVKIIANDVKISGFKIQWSAYPWGGVNIRFSDNNIISNNIIANNSWCGIDAIYSNNNVITENEIEDNHCGIYLGTGSTNNLIYHNNFNNLLTDVQAYAKETGNTWDDGYPSGGNYWSDYEERYPDAKELDGSGIWDTPYEIDENNQDNYPLMELWSPKPPSPMEALEELIQTVESWDVGTGVETSLTSKLQAAYWSLDRENQNASIGQLTAFINEVEALRGKKLTNEQADQLISEAQRIIDLIKE